MRKLLAATSAAYLFAGAACAPYMIQHVPENVTPRYVVTAKSPDAWLIRSIQSNLERVPDAIQRRVNEFGVVVVIFDGNLTDDGNISELRGKTVPNGLIRYNEANGAYEPQWKKAFVKQDPRPSWYREGYLELHEYGHATDFAFGKPSNSEEFRSEVEKIAAKDWDIFEKIRREKMSRMIFFDTLKGGEYDQIWADSFAMFYLSGESRSALMENFQELHDYFVRFEDIVANGE